MENLSIMIWNELRRFVGTEEQVLIIRRTFELAAFIKSPTIPLFSANPSSVVFTGSNVEGLELRESDIDVIFVIDNMSFSDSDTDPVPDIIIDTKNIKLGYVRLRCHDYISYPDIISFALAETDNGLVLSSLLFRVTVVNSLQIDFPSSVGHGPCSTFKIPRFNIDTDWLNNWPVVAKEWIGRNRNYNWPPRDLISDIKRDGFHVVPIGTRNSKGSHLQWRISFKMAKKKLIHSFNHTQFLCYGLLKLYLRHNKENFLDCFLTCFRRLIKWVKDEYCPNYFIKENNMFEGKICGDKGKRLLGYLNELYHKGLHTLRIPCLSELQSCTIYTPVLSGKAITDAEREFFCDLNRLKVLSNRNRTRTFSASIENKKKINLTNQLRIDLKLQSIVI
ncbi:hypothetical protein KUTeg_000590 [Tegillarca granosa]|uniref:Mab-21-like HhH/H2TH-like domain-containing protein n=1 Tax=Tegillarca granosa TaxID=220873 RepID=A0ABQ9FXZ6_TEGGR|nr:hypothetical protein KUTeg_000590 [Tegillarca granosa]